MLFFRQIKAHGDNFSYVFGPEDAHELAIVDCSYNAQELIRLIKEKESNLTYIFNTHEHSDHTAGNTAVQSAVGGKIVGHRLAKGKVDRRVDDGEVLQVANVAVKVIYTPGHTPDGICLLLDGEKLLTGDTLFVGECGRTDFPGGDSRSLYYSLFNKLLTLPDAVEVYPGHDYGPKPSSTIGRERCTNYVLEPRTVEEFAAFMSQP